MLKCAAVDNWDYEYRKLEARLRATRWQRFCAAVQRLLGGGR